MELCQEIQQDVAEVPTTTTSTSEVISFSKVHISEPPELQVGQYVMDQDDVSTEDLMKMMNPI